MTTLRWMHVPAAAAGPVYAFRGAGGRVEWPIHQGCNLGGAGVWNFLWRLGIRPGEPAFYRRGILFLAVDGPMPDTDAQALRARIASGDEWLVAAGVPEALQPLLPSGVILKPETSPFPSAALAWQGLVHERPQIVAPPAWPFFRIADGGDRVESFGELVALRGERQSPDRALRFPLQAPAALRSGKLVLLNSSPFAALQSWLQGQEDLEPWLAWRHGIFWLDEQVEFLADAIEHLGVPLSQVPAPGISGLAATTVILRHDVDSSNDVSLLEAEKAAGVKATHALLLDDNSGFWVDKLNRAPGHEAAFHYDTLHSDTRLERLRRLAGWRPPTEYRPGYRAVAGTGLLQQLRAAQARGIETATLHRHASFILYPELVDALDHVFSEESGVLGSSSFFRAQVLRWGIDRCDGARGTCGQFPYPMFPFWLPFRLAHAGQGGRLLSGFESTSMMECEPDLVAQMLDYRPRRLLQRVFTFNYHPFHAARSTFTPAGTLVWFDEVISILTESKISIMTFSEVLDRCHHSDRENQFVVF